MSADILERLDFMLISRRSDEDAIIRDARAEIVRRRGEVEELKTRRAEDVSILDDIRDAIGGGPYDTIAKRIRQAIAPAEAKDPAPAMPNVVDSVAYLLDELRFSRRGYFTSQRRGELADKLEAAIAADFDRLRAADNRDAAGVDSEEDAYVIERMGKLLAEIAVIVNGPEPDMTRWSYHDLPEKVRALKDTLAAVPAGEAVAYSVVQVGNRGAAYDPPNTHRAFTYEHQPGNIDASRLGRATAAAALASAGDGIDRGLSLLKELQALGFGVFQIGPPAPVQAAPQEGEDAAEAYRKAWEAGHAAACELVVDDAMVERVCRNHFPDWDMYGPAGKMVRSADIRRLLTAALQHRGDSRGGEG